MRWLRTKLYQVLARQLTKPRGRYHLAYPNNAAALQAALQPADVLLVDGDQRISIVIQCLTQSSWSHAALYVGDEPWRRWPERRPELEARFGADARALLVEALLEGVVLAPLSKYLSQNLRICRAQGLRPEHARRVVDEVLAQLGAGYDVRNLLELARYFFPVTVIPRRFRRRALELGSPLTREVICSAMIARAFHNVGFPILPEVSWREAPQHQGWLSRLRIVRAPYPAVFRHEPPRLVTPRDFDLSPFFAVVKPNGLAVPRFDYRRIRWAS
jgi:hypothetical protein